MLSLAAESSRDDAMMVVDGDDAIVAGFETMRRVDVNGSQFKSRAQASKDLK